MIELKRVVSIWIDDVLAEALSKVAESRGFKSRSELIEQVLREVIKHG